MDGIGLLGFGLVSGKIEWGWPGWWEALGKPWSVGSVGSVGSSQLAVGEKRRGRTRDKVTTARRKVV